MLESKIQSKIIKELEKVGWYVIKIIQSNKNGIPDLMCLKNGRCIFLEVKCDDGKPSEMQKYRIKQLLDNGFKATIVHNATEAIRYCEEI